MSSYGIRFVRFEELKDRHRLMSLATGSRAGDSVHSHRQRSAASSMSTVRLVGNVTKAMVEHPRPAAEWSLWMQQQRAYLLAAASMSAGNALDGARTRSHSVREGATARSMLWTSSMKLPLCQSAYETLALRRSDASSITVAFAEVRDLFPTQRDERCATRLWSLLTTHEPLLATVPFLPYLCVAIGRGMPSNPIAAFEGAMFFLQNHCREWIEAYPSAPTAHLLKIDQFVARHPKLSHLWTFLNDGHLTNGPGSPSVSFLDYLWVPLQTFFLLNISDAVTWLKFFDDVVCRPDGGVLLNAMCVALLLHVKDALLLCETRDHVLAVVGAPLGLNEKQMRSFMAQTERIAMSAFSSVQASPFLVCAEPVVYLFDAPEYSQAVRSPQYYPVVHVGSRPVARQFVDKRRQLAAIEASQEALERRLKVDVTAVSMVDEMKRFHTALHNNKTDDTGTPSVALGRGDRVCVVEGRRKEEQHSDPQHDDDDDVETHSATATTLGHATTSIPDRSIFASSTVHAVRTTPLHGTSTDGASFNDHAEPQWPHGTSADGARTRAAPSRVPESVRQAVALMLAHRSLTASRSTSQSTPPPPPPLRDVTSSSESVPSAINVLLPHKAAEVHSAPEEPAPKVVVRIASTSIPSSRGRSSSSVGNGAATNSVGYEGYSSRTPSVPIPSTC